MKTSIFDYEYFQELHSTNQTTKEEEQVIDYKN